MALTPAEALCEPRKPMRHVHFHTKGFISQLAVVEGSLSVEVGMVGSEVMLGAHAALGVATAPLQALVQGVAMTLRLSAVPFKKQWQAARCCRVS